MANFMNVTFDHNPKSKIIEINRPEKQQYVFVTDQTELEPVQLTFKLKEPESNLEVLGFVLGDDEKKINLNVTIEHRAPNTKGQVLLKSVLNDQAQQEVKGIIRIPKGSKGAESFLSHRTLMLSPNAKTKTSPQLEILEDDVKAKHAATAGKIDQDQMFYLKSRGLGENEAQNLIVEGFGQELIEKIQDLKIREQLCQLI